MPAPPLTTRRILRFWLPLAGTWLMMAVEGPFLAAVIARLPDAIANLAAFGVTFALAIVVEAPVLMLLSASTALVADRESLAALRRFVSLLNALLTGLFLILLAPPVFHAVVNLLDLPAAVARLTYGALVCFVPWPAAIGYRRFYQGLMIRHGQTRWVAYGTVCRVTSMGGSALALASLTGLDGVRVGAIALSTGVIVEALFSRWVSRGVVRDLGGRARVETSTDVQTLGAIAAFYLPLALTSMIGTAVQPLITFFMGHGRDPIESLAVLPVVNGLTFVFRALALSYHEVAVALLTEDGTQYGRVRDFAVRLGVATSLGLAAIGFTPLWHVRFATLSGLTPDLARFAVLPTRILAPLPALTVMLSVQRALLVRGRRTRAVTSATVAEVAVIAAILWVGIERLDLPGVVAAALALLAGRIVGTVWLLKPAASMARALESDPR